MTTVFLFASLGLLLAGAVTSWAVFLWFGLRLVKCQHLSTRSIGIATLIIHLYALTSRGAAIAVHEWVPDLTLGLVAVLLLTDVLIAWLVISHMFKLSGLKAFFAWLPTLVSPIPLLLITALVFRPFVFEAFAIPTNSMAPTLLGHHIKMSCPDCGNMAFASVWASDYNPHTNWICEDNFHVNEMVVKEDSIEITGDRILVSKFLRPRRWDLVVFKFPENPSQSYVMRLVGLPGEVITIRDGQVDANGELLERPSSFQGIKYESEFEFHYEPLWGSAERPATLADDEYFTLGDFSLQAKDSRLWEVGAPGHPPYAVPEAYIVAVVTHIYWPLSRWRTFR